MGRRQHPESTERAQPADAGAQGPLLGVPGRGVSGASNGPARDRPPADSRRKRAARRRRRLHVPGPAAVERTALPGRGREAGAEEALGQHRGGRAPMTAAVAPGMRIAFLSVSGEMGGSEVSLLELVRGLRRLVPAWPLDLVVPREGPLAAAARACGASVHVLPLPSRLARLGETSGRGASEILGRGLSIVMAAGSINPYPRRLARLLARLAPDVLHTNGFKLHVLGARAAPPSAALVWHIHEYVARRPISRALLGRYAPRGARTCSLKPFV